MSLNAQSRNVPSNNVILRHDRTTTLNEPAWRYALSPDAKSIAVIGLRSGKIYVVDISSGRQIEVNTPDLRAKTLLCWSRDGTHLAAANTGTLIIASVEQAITLQQIDNSQLGGFGRAALYSNDGSTLYVQNSNITSKALVLAVDLSSSNIEQFIETPVHDARAVLTLPGRFQSLGNGDFFSCAIGRWDGRLGPAGRRDFDFKSFVIPLSRGIRGPTPADLIVDFAHGIDGSGVVRALDFKCLYSEAVEATVVFRPSGTKLTTVPVDITKDKAFETYDADGRRASTFGGYGVLEGNSISDFDLHPTRPWAVTTAPRVRGANGREVGMITVWDIRTGDTLQRLEAPVDIADPTISRDGSLLAVNAENGIRILRFVDN